MKSTKIRSLIIDDEPSGRELLEGILVRHYPQVEIVASVGTLQEAIQEVDDHKPDLVFLDIKLGNDDGFDLLTKTKFDLYHVIFVTAYSEFALRALKASAVDYLLKPIGIAEVGASIDRFREATEKVGVRQLAMIKEYVRKEQLKPREKLSVSTLDGYEFISADDVLYLKADRNYTEIHLKNVKHKVITKAIGVLEKELPLYPFFRIHKSYIINLNEVTQYVPGNGGYVRMTDQKRLEVSRRKKKQLLQVMGIDQ